MGSGLAGRTVFSQVIGNDGLCLHVLGVWGFSACVTWSSAGSW